MKALLLKAFDTGLTKNRDWSCHGILQNQKGQSSRSQTALYLDEMNIALLALTVAPAAIISLVAEPDTTVLLKAAHLAIMDRAKAGSRIGWVAARAITLVAAI